MTKIPESIAAAQMNQDPNEADGIDTIGCLTGSAIGAVAGWKFGDHLYEGHNLPTKVLELGLKIGSATVGLVGGALSGMMIATFMPGHRRDA